MTENSYYNILIIGAGAFGLALSSSFVSSKNRVTILARTTRNFEKMKQHPLLKESNFVTFDEFNSDFYEFDLIIFAIPSQSLRSVCEWMLLKIQSQSHVKFKNSHHKLNLISTAKGIENDSLLLPSQILEELWEDKANIATLSGPSFAREILSGLPTCVLLASKSETLLSLAPGILRSQHLRIYESKDIIGVEVGGALKNVIAMVAGAVDGLKLGANARAAVITRGLSEIARVGVKLGADPITFLGLSGVGDLILTCTSDLSRNRQFGYRLAQGESKEDIITSMGQVIEGVSTTLSAYQLCMKLGIETTILRASYFVLYEDMPIKDILPVALEKEAGSEFDWT